MPLPLHQPVRVQAPLILPEVLLKPFADLVPDRVGFLLFCEEQPDRWGLFEQNGGVLTHAVLFHVELVLGVGGGGGVGRGGLLLLLCGFLL